MIVYDYIEYMNAYRVSDTEHPEQTIAYLTDTDMAPHVLMNDVETLDGSDEDETRELLHKEIIRQRLKYLQ